MKLGFFANNEVIFFFLKFKIDCIVGTSGWQGKGSKTFITLESKITLCGRTSHCYGRASMRMSTLFNE